VELDRRRAVAGDKGFSPGSAFDPRGAREVFELVSLFDDSYTALALRQFDRGAVEYPSWQALLHKVRRSD
jgi:hypothetical protein